MRRVSYRPFNREVYAGWLPSTSATLLFLLMHIDSLLLVNPALPAGFAIHTDPGRVSHSESRHPGWNTGNISGCALLSQPPLAMVFTNQRDMYCDALLLAC